jgi:phenylacetate-CoA ligase
MDSYLEALIQHRVRYLMGYSSSLYMLALHAIGRGRQDLQLAVCISNAEPLYGHQRQMIAKAFHSPVCQTYGMAEIVTAASECPFGTMHLWPEVGIVEILDDEGNPVHPGETGHLVCTGLLNDDMPLIRYRIGDKASFPSDPARCACGRTLPILASIEGRVDDTIICPDGRRIGRLDPVFKGALPVTEAQIIQETPTSILVKVVPGLGYSNSTEEILKKRIFRRLGKGIKIIIEPVHQIPRGPSGKFKAVVSLLRTKE